MAGMTFGQTSHEPVDTALVVPHTHWEGAVFKTREEYLEIGLPHILKALTMLKTYPDYRFVLDQMCYILPFLERYPAEVPAFRKFLAEGRLQIAGGTNSMHDNNMPSGESIVRQYLLSKWYFRDRLGYDVTTGWALDTFGHNAQMPQILKLAGMKSYWFQRGPASPEVPAEFFWEGIDGSRIPAFWLARGYSAIANVAANAADFGRQIRGAFDQATPWVRGNERVLMAGADVWEPEWRLPPMMDQFNRTSAAPFKLQFGTPSEYEALIGKRTNRPVIKGDFNPIFQGIYSSRIEVKQTMRDIERILTSAEKAGVVAEWLGAPSHRSDVERAWEPVLFNQAHDLASGVMVDKVYDDTMMSYGFARRLGDEMLRSELNTIAAQINSAGNGLPIAVFNLLGWARTDAVEVDAGFSEPGVQALGVVDPTGKPIPVQMLQANRNDDGGIRQARIAFIARDVPAMGYAVYRVSPNPSEHPAAPMVPGADANTRYQDKGVIENEFYRATFNLWNGDMTSLMLKESNWEVLKTPGNVIAKEKDGGDFWELYGNLNGGRQTVMNKEIGVPNPARTEWSSDWVGGNGVTRPGAVVSEFRITHPFGKSVYSSRVRLYSGIRRIEITMEILNQDESVRYRAMFPTTIDAGRNTQEIAFGAIERPEKSEFPAQNWADYGDGSKGLTLVNRGMPGNNVAGGTLMLSLMRSARINSYGFADGYEPGVSSDSGLELGKRLTFQYALVPHAGDWRAAGAWREGLEFNNPLIVKMLDAHVGPLPNQWGMLKVSHANAVVSALKPGRDGAAILRIYEASGKATSGVTVQTAATLITASETNLIEDPDRTLGVHDNQITFDLGPYEIKTFRLQMAPFQGKKP